MSNSRKPVNLLLKSERSSRSCEIEQTLEKINKWTFDINRVTSPEAGFEYFEENPIDCVMVNSPRDSEKSNNIFKFIREIRDENDVTPIIAISSDRDEQSVASLFRAGCDDYRQYNELTPSVMADALNFSMTKRHRRQQLKRAARIDGLTELNNRQYQLEIMEDRMKDAIRNDQKLYTAFIDLDDFKQVNDAHGHSMGDTILKEIAEIISGSIRDDDSVGRYGGDEFLVLIADSDMDGARTALDRILHSINANVFTLGENGTSTVSLTASVGVAELDGREFDNFDFPNLLKGYVDKADKALYMAKGKGGDRIRKCTYTRDSKVENRTTTDRQSYYATW